MTVYLCCLFRCFDDQKIMEDTSNNERAKKNEPKEIYSIVQKNTKQNQNSPMETTNSQNLIGVECLALKRFCLSWFVKHTFGSVVFFSP